MKHAPKNKKSNRPFGRLSLFLLLALTLFMPQNRVWGFSGEALPGVGQILAASSMFIGGNCDEIQYDASGYTVAPKTTVLGENMSKRVIPFANKTNGRTLPFGTTADEWAKLSPKQRFKLNDGALRTRIGEGDSFRYIGADPYRNPALRQQFDLTGSELLRLKGRGIPYETVSPQAVQSVLGRP